MPYYALVLFFVWWKTNVLCSFCLLSFRLVDYMLSCWCRLHKVGLQQRQKNTFRLQAGQLRHAACAAREVKRRSTRLEIVFFFSLNNVILKKKRKEIAKLYIVRYLFWSTVQFVITVRDFIYCIFYCSVFVYDFCVCGCILCYISEPTSSLLCTTTTIITKSHKYQCSWFCISSCISHLMFHIIERSALSVTLC